MSTFPTFLSSLAAAGVLEAGAMLAELTAPAPAAWELPGLHDLVDDGSGRPAIVVAVLRDTLELVLEEAGNQAPVRWIVDMAAVAVVG